MNILGLSGGFHDAAATVLNRRGEILFASHSERYSGKKNDPLLDRGLLESVLDMDIRDIAWYERPWLHNLQQYRSGQGSRGAWTLGGTIRQHIGKTAAANKKLHCFGHHLSHAAAAFQASPFDGAAVVVIDAIGELDTISIYDAHYDSNGKARYQRMWHRRYPHSIGLFYSAITHHVGLRAGDEEYITMGMAALGENRHYKEMAELVLDDLANLKFAKNLHVGFGPADLPYKDVDTAATAQALLEVMVEQVICLAKRLTGRDNLAYGGGVALNCVANSRILGKYFDKIWITPSPGDAGSSLGAAALAYGGKIHWQNAFLGYDIGNSSYPVEPLVTELLTAKIAGVASGRAEFGPRALGNRSLLADPRDADTKYRVNLIKQRQQFRPFAPVILLEHVNSYFKMPVGWQDSAYMQTVAAVKNPELYPAITHVDGTARVQTVAPGTGGIRLLLESWFEKTGCPMLLNTSLNIRGEPMVNNRTDADRFERLYGVNVYS